jgi:hypothetical protein
MTTGRDESTGAGSSGSPTSTGWRDKIDAITAALGIALGVVISSVSIRYESEYFITLGPMLVIVCSCYLIFRRKLNLPQRSAEAVARINPVYPMVTEIIFWLVFSGSIFSLTTQVLHRPLIYFILTAVASSTIALQILQHRNRSTVYLIMFKILLISLSIRASAVWVFPTLPGSDPWAHLVDIQRYLDYGHISEAALQGLDTSYLNYPTIHLISLITKLVTGASFKAAMFLAIGLPPLWSTIAVFFIGRMLASDRVGLLAMLLVNISDYHLQYSIQLTATGFNLGIFAVVVYLLIRNTYYPNLLSTVLIILLFLLMVRTHTMSTFVAFCFVFFSFAGERLYQLLYRKQANDNNMVTSTMVALFGVSMLMYWIYSVYQPNTTFFAIVTRAFYRALIEQAGFLHRVAPPTVYYGYLLPVIQISGFILLYTVGLAGCLVWLSPKSQNKVKITLITVLLLLNAFALAFPLFGLRNIVPYRWFAFIYVILAIPAAFSILNAVYRIGYRKLAGGLLACLVFIISFFMTTDNMANMDSPVYASELNQRMMYSNSEVAAAEKATQIYNDYIVTDAQFGSRILATYLGYNKVSFNMNREDFTSKGMVIWRDVMAGRPVGVADEELVLGQQYEQSLEKHIIAYMLIIRAGFFCLKENKCQMEHENSLKISAIRSPV